MSAGCIVCNGFTACRASLLDEASHLCCLKALIDVVHEQGVHISTILLRELAQRHFTHLVIAGLSDSMANTHHGMPLCSQRVSMQS